MVVGDRTGYLYAYHLADGSAVPGWPVSDGGAPIDSTPSVAALGPGTLDTGVRRGGQRAEPGRRRVRGLRARRPAAVAHRSERPVHRPAPGLRRAGVAHRRRPAGRHGRFRRLVGPGVLRPRRRDGVRPGGVAVLQCRQRLFDRRRRRPLRHGPGGTGGGRRLDRRARPWARATRTAAMCGCSTPRGRSSTTTTPTRRSTPHPPSEGSWPEGRRASPWGRARTTPGASDTDTLKAFTTRLGLVWSDTLDGHHVVEPGAGRRRGQRAAGRGRGHRHRHARARSGCWTGPPGRRSGTSRWWAG